LSKNWSTSSKLLIAVEKAMEKVPSIFLLPSSYPESKRTQQVEAFVSEPEVSMAAREANLLAQMLESIFVQIQLLFIHMFDDPDAFSAGAPVKTALKALELVLKCHAYCKAIGSKSMTEVLTSSISVSRRTEHI